MRVAKQEPRGERAADAGSSMLSADEFTGFDARRIPAAGEGSHQKNFKGEKRRLYNTSRTCR